MAGKGKPYETQAAYEARVMWQESFERIKTLYAERDRLHDAYGPEAEIGQLNQQIEEAQQDERGFWETYCEIAKTFVAA